MEQTLPRQLDSKALLAEGVDGLATQKRKRRIRRRWGFLVALVLALAALAWKMWVTLFW